MMRSTSFLILSPYSYGKDNTGIFAKQVISVTKRKNFKKCSISSCGLSEGVHPYGVLKRYHDYVIFDFNVRVIFRV